MISHSPEETERMAQQLAKDLKGNETICLFGDLGSGKTLFTKSLAQTLGIEKKSIKSPTFTIQREYDLTDQKAQHLVHFDLYRLDSLDESTYENLAQCYQKPNTITIIEWADRAGDSLPAERIEIHMSYFSEDQREININAIAKS